MNFDTMSKQRKMILIAAAVGVISMFLPWASLGTLGSVNGMHGGGILVFICFLACGFLAFNSDQTTNLTKMNWMITLIAGGLALLIAVYNFFDIPKVIIGFGIYLTIAASIAILAFAYMHRSAGDSLQGGFDTLKNSFNNSSQGGPSSNDPNRPTV